MAFGSGIRPWVRGTMAKIATSTAVLGQGELLVDEAGGIYGGDGVTQLKALSRAARLADLRPAIEQTFYVSKGAKASDSNDGLSWATAFATPDAALVAARASGTTWSIQIGIGNFATNKLVLDSGCVIQGVNKNLTTLSLRAGSNTNIIEDSTLGSQTLVNTSGVIQGLTLWGNRTNQTLAAASTLMTVAVTSGAPLSATTPSTINVYDASAFQAAGYTSGTIFVGASLCTFTGLTNTGSVYDPANPATTGWTFTGVRLVSSAAKATYVAGALVLPGKPWGHGIALQSSYTVVRDVFVYDCTGSSFYLQGAAGNGSVEVLLDNCKSQQANRYDFEIAPSATDARILHPVGADSQLGGMLIMGANTRVSGAHPAGVYPPASQYRSANAPYNIIICGDMVRLDDVHFDLIANSLIQVNLAYMQYAIETLHIDGDCYLSPAAANGGAVGLELYGPPALYVHGLDLKLGLKGRFLYGMTLQPTSETILQTGGSFSTPGSGGTATKLQVISAHPFSILGSAVAGTLDLGGLDTISYTGKQTSTAFLTATANSGDTSITLNSTAGFDSSGMVLVVPQNTTVASVQSYRLNYTGISGNTLTGIPTSGTGSIAQALSDEAVGFTSIPSGVGVTQHFLTGVKSTGAGGVSIPTATYVMQAGRRITNVQSAPDPDVRLNIEGNRRPVAVFPQGLGTPVNLNVTGRINGQKNPMSTTVTIPVGSSSASVAHGLFGQPTAAWGIPLTDPQQRWWVTRDGTNVTVNLAAAVATTAVTFRVWAQMSTTS